MQTLSDVPGWQQHPHWRNVLELCCKIHLPYSVLAEKLPFCFEREGEEKGERREDGREKERERSHPSVNSPQMPEGQEFYPSLPQRWQGHKHLSCHLSPSRVHISRNLQSGAKPGPETGTPVCGAGVPQGILPAVPDTCSPKQLI